MRSAAATLLLGASGGCSPTKRWESGLTSPWKKLMARLRQRLRRGKTCRAFVLLFYDDSFDAPRRETGGVWCTVSSITMYHNFRECSYTYTHTNAYMYMYIYIYIYIHIYSAATMLMHLCELGADPARCAKQTWSRVSNVRRNDPRDSALRACLRPFVKSGNTSCSQRNLPDAPSASLGIAKRITHLLNLIPPGSRYVNIKDCSSTRSDFSRITKEMRDRWQSALV
jgi:hypothetical protein